MSNTITPCRRCGKRMLPGQRFEATRTVNVLVCLGENGCGYETPPFGPCCRRVRHETVQHAACQRCGGDLKPRDTQRTYRYCSWVCRYGRVRVVKGAA